MFSATWPEEVQTLAHDFLKDRPVRSLRSGKGLNRVARKEGCVCVCVCLLGQPSFLSCFFEFFCLWRLRMLSRVIAGEQLLTAGSSVI